MTTTSTRLKPCSELVGGLLYCNIGECRQIPVQTEEFVQILNSNVNHCVTVSAVNCAPGEVQACGIVCIW